MPERFRTREADFRDRFKLFSERIPSQHFRRTDSNSKFSKGERKGQSQNLWAEHGRSIRYTVGTMKKTSILIGKSLIEAQFTERVNRFLCTVLLNGDTVNVHLHDPGRLKELLLPGSKVLLREENAPHRKTNYDLVGIYTEDILVSCDSRAPNNLVKKALQKKAIPQLPDYQTVTPEYTYRHSRIDFCLDEKILVEVKGVTLVKNGKALFPDAPTERGRKHLQTLISALEKGFCSYILFMIQRPDAFRFSPNRKTDPAFADTLSQAVEKGVSLLVYTSEFVGNYLCLKENLTSIEL